MTKISDVEANLEQFKSETLASQEETQNLFGQMQESIDRNKVSSGGIFQNYPGNTFRDAGGIFANTTVPPTSTVHGSERGRQPGSDHRWRKLKMPLFDGEDRPLGLYSYLLWNEI
ncbi:hypothetical protein Tco_1155396 [Tanacetum coccineum]